MVTAEDHKKDCGEDEAGRTEMWDRLVLGSCGDALGCGSATNYFSLPFLLACVELFSLLILVEKRHFGMN